MDRIIRIQDVRNPVAGKLQLDDGSVHDVLKMTGVQYQAVQSIDASDAATALYDLAAEVAPTIPKETLLAFDKDVVQVILKIATVGIEALEQMYRPNAESPERSISPG